MASRYEIIFTKKDTTATITYVDGVQDTRVLKREFHQNENYPKKVILQLDNHFITAADNLLSSSFDGWSDSAARALDIGDSLKYSIYPTATGTKTAVFNGVIQKLSEGSDGVLHIEATDYLQWYENQKLGKTVYENYRDQEIHDTSYDVSTKKWHVDDVTDSDIVAPIVSLEYAASDEAIVVSNKQDSSFNMKQDAIAQKFYPTLPLFVGWGLIAYDGALNSCQVKLLPADSSGLPDTANPIYEDTFYLGGGSSGYVAAAVNLDEPIVLVVGRPYYLYFYFDGSGGYDQDLAICDSPEYSLNYYYHKPDGGSWTQVAGHVLACSIGMAEYEELDSSAYTIDEASDIIIIEELPAGVLQSTYFNSGNYWETIDVGSRARLNYYYGKTDLETVFGGIIGLCSDITASISTDCDREIPIYRTKGKSLGDCLRELCDLFETSGTYSGRQHTIGHYLSGSTHYIKTGFRYKTTDTASYTFADSGTTDSTLRITNCALTKTVKDRASGVVMVGKDANGYPLIAARDDRGKASSFRTKCRFPVVDTVYDDNLNTLAAVNEAAFLYLDSVNRDIWEGQITVAGVYPDLFEINTASDYFGSGKVITLNYAKLGLSGVAFKVTGIVVNEETTEITLNNIDSLLTNRLTKTMGRSSKSEAFSGPEDLQGQYFFSCYENAVHDGTYYMQLCKASGTAIDGSERVLCTKFTSSSYTSGGYNCITYHAEFEMENGYTEDGTSLITHIELYSAASGGSAVTQYALSTAERFPKWKSMRVIIDYTVKAS